MVREMPSGCGVGGSPDFKVPLVWLYVETVMHSTLPFPEGADPALPGQIILVAGARM